MSGEKWSTVSFVMTDGVNTQSASMVINGSAWWNLPVNASAFNDGPVTLTVTETDPEGNPNVVTLNLVKDTVAPAGSWNAGLTVINGMGSTKNPTLTLNMAYTDAISGLYQMAFSINGGAYSAPQAYASKATVVLPGADGVYTVSARVWDAAGNVFTYGKSIRLDRTGPSLTTSVTAPTDGTAYDIGRLINVSYSATDADNVVTISAVLDSTTAVASGAVINTESLTAGTHSLVITAVDGLGNVTTTTTTIIVMVWNAGLVRAVNDGVTNGLITSSATSSQLLSYLASAKAAVVALNNPLAKTYLASFISYVQAQSGLTINAAYATQLVGWANNLISRL
jgi:hypothetical protein